MNNLFDNLKYKTDDHGSIQSIIYPLNTLINNNSANTILGGSIQLETEKARFEGLGVPVGLYVSRKHRSLIDNIPRAKNSPNDAQHECMVIDDTAFNKLIDKIAHKTGNAKTLKLRESGMKKTKRNK